MAASVLSACDAFDPGMRSGCAMTFRLGRPNSYVAPGCVGDPAALMNSGQAWLLGSNAPRPGGSHCGDFPQLAARISGDGSTPLLFNWGTDNTVRLGIVKNACADNTEITFAMFNPDTLPAKGLRSHHEIKIVGRSGINHVNVAAYVKDPAGVRYTLAMVFRPTSGADPRWNTPAPGVFFRGSSEIAGTHLILLDASYFGVPRLCNDTSCGPTAIDLDWDRYFNFVMTTKGWWPGLKDAWQAGQAKASIATQVQTYDLGGRIRIDQRNTRISY